MFDSFFQNPQINILLIFLLIWTLLFFLVKHPYVHQKIQWWIYIILFFIFLFINNITLIIGILMWFIASSYEFYKCLYSIKNLWNIKRTLIWIIFFLLLTFFSYFIIQASEDFFILFIIIAFSDIIAYFTWKYFPWKKGFTKLSPNKTLSWVLAQILFITLLMILAITITNIEQNLNIFTLLISITIWILAPTWDLLESYFKRKSWIKDMAHYIPGHWWVLDRIDSILLSGFVIWLYLYIIALGWTNIIFQW